MIVREPKLKERRRWEEVSSKSGFSTRRMIAPTTGEEYIPSGRSGQAEGSKWHTIDIGETGMPKSGHESQASNYPGSVGGHGAMRAESHLVQIASIAKLGDEADCYSWGTSYTDRC